MTTTQYSLPRTILGKIHARTYLLYKPILRMLETRPIKSDFSLRVPFAHQNSPTKLTTAAVCHLFNIDLAEEIKGYLSNLPTGTGLFLTTDTQEKALFLKKCFEDWTVGTLEIRVVENRGRDIAPKYVACRDVLENFDLVLFVHSKKTASMNGAADWRKWLFQSLCGSRNIVDSILFVFNQRDDIGIVFPQNYPSLRRYMMWSGMFPLARKTAARLGFSLRRSAKLDFPAGSFFWARSKALRPILDLQLTIADFPPEAGQTNGTLAHVLERLVLHTCEFAGYRWIKTLASDYPEAPETIVTIDGRKDLDRFISDHSFSLLGSGSQPSLGPASHEGRI